MANKITEQENLNKVAGGTEEGEKALFDKFLESMYNRLRTYPERLQQIARERFEQIIKENEDYDWFYIKQLIQHEMGNLMSGWTSERIK